MGNIWEIHGKWWKYIYIWDNHGSGSATTGIWASQTGMAWRGYNVDGLVDEGWEWCCGIFDYFWGGNLGKMWSAMPCFEWTGSYTSCYLPCVRWFWKHLTAHSTAHPGSNNRSCCLDISVCASKTLEFLINMWGTMNYPPWTFSDPYLGWFNPHVIWKPTRAEIQRQCKMGPHSVFFWFVTDPTIDISTASIPVIQANLSSNLAKLISSFVGVWWVELNPYLHY